MQLEKCQAGTERVTEFQPEFSMSFFAISFQIQYTLIKSGHTYHFLKKADFVSAVSLYKQVQSSGTIFQHLIELFNSWNEWAGRQ